VLPALAANDVALFAVSYDAVAILSAFAETHGIGFSLLSDEGSVVMRNSASSTSAFKTTTPSTASPHRHAT
jgi:peroxiredoxin